MINDTFIRLHFISAQCIIETENYPDIGIILNCEDDDYSQGYHQIKEAFKASTKGDISNKSDDNFRSSKIRADDLGYNLYVFDLRYQRNFTSSQPIKVELDLMEL